MTDGFEFDPRFSAIAFTGGDVGGKSTLMPRAKKYLESLGMRVAISAEVASEIISAGFSPTDTWGDSSFQEHIFRYVVDREEMYYRMLKGLTTDQPLVLLCDRGILDAVAYIGRVNFERMARKHGKEPLHLRERYKAVVHMVTAAKGAEEAYLENVANNPGRIQRSLEEVRILDDATIQAWIGHPHFTVVDNSTDFNGKIERAMAALRRVLPMPKAIEQERKFVVHQSRLPKGAQMVMIFQDYLKNGPDGAERRLRIKQVDQSFTHYYTEKHPTEALGAREETERQISEKEYWAMLDDLDPASTRITKVRHTFEHHGKMFEHDIYISPTNVAGLQVIEIENSTPGERIEFPSGYQVSEVTGREEYSNRFLALGRSRPSL